MLKINRLPESIRISHDCENNSVIHTMFMKINELVDSNNGLVEENKLLRNEVHMLQGKVGTLEHINSDKY